MTKLECSVKNCMHNSDNYCCKSAILVDGNEAVPPNEPCCAAERIDIAGDGACECGQTRCATFKAR